MVALRAYTNDILDALSTSIDFADRIFISKGTFSFTWNYRATMGTGIFIGMNLGLKLMPVNFVK